MRRSIRFTSVVATLATAALSLVAVILLASPAEAAATPNRQVITVQSSSPGATTARLDLWTDSTGGAGYTHTAGPITAYVGELGIGQTRDNVARTPAGVFNLTQAFGNQPNNGTALPYFQATRLDWWNGEDASPHYNQHVHQVPSPGPNSENLYDAGYVYSHAVVIDYNMHPTRPGAGSAFFLHVTNGQPTAGCVAVAASSLDMIMRWLKPGLHPVISIGVGAAATSIVTQHNAAMAKHNPYGNVDSVSGGAGKVGAVGWAADPDNVSLQVPVNLWVDGVIRVRGITGVSRPDVAAAKHVGPRQGYTMSFSGVKPGVHSVCVTANNRGMGTGGTLIGCGKVRTS